MSKKQIRAVIFDWGGTCCVEGEPFASRALQERVGMNPDQIAEAVESILFDYYRGKHNRETFWRAVMRHFSLEEGPEINPIALSKTYLYSYTVFPEVLGMAQKLKNKYKVGLLSNLTPEMRDHIRHLEKPRLYFDWEVYSCDPDVGIMKPDEKIYRVLLERMQTDPQESLFIDNARKNCEAAEGIGMKAIFFESPEQLLQELRPHL